MKDFTCPIIIYFFTHIGNWLLLDSNETEFVNVVLYFSCHNAYAVTKYPIPIKCSAWLYLLHKHKYKREHYGSKDNHSTTTRM